MQTTDRHGMPTCPCKWCGKPTPMLGTKECDGCHELVRRVQADPQLALRARHETETLRVVASGNPFDGITLHGPFIDQGDDGAASEWADRNLRRLEPDWGWPP